MSTKVEFVKLNPNKNTTILVLNKFLRENYAYISNIIMKPESIGAEQVGFIEKSSTGKADYRLQMMGGEFCANAVASLSAYLAYQEKLEPNKEIIFKIETSGIKEIIQCKTSAIEDGYRVKIPMPLCCIKDKEIMVRGDIFKIILFEYESMHHAIVHCKKIGRQEKILAKEILYSDMLNKSPVRGVTLYVEKENIIAPLIYVEKTNTEVWENSCGVASSAISIYMAVKRKKNVKIMIKQPSEEFIQAEAVFFEGKVREANIEENVYISAIGTAFI